MKVADLSDNLKALAGAFVDWAACVRSPFSRCKELLAEKNGHDNVIAYTTKLWATSYVITFFISGWIYQLYGIDFTNIGFHLSFAASGILLQLIIVVSVQYAMKLFRLHTSVRQVFVTFTIYGAALYPFTYLFGFLDFAVYIAELKQIKTEGGTFEEVFRYMSGGESPLKKGQITEGLYGFGLVFVFFFSLIGGAFALNTLAVISKNNLARVFNAASFGIIVVSIVPSIFLGYLQTFIIYAFL